MSDNNSNQTLKNIMYLISSITELFIFSVPISESVLFGVLIFTTGLRGISEFSAIIMDSIKICKSRTENIVRPMVEIQPVIGIPFF